MRVPSTPARERWLLAALLLPLASLFIYIDLRATTLTLTCARIEATLPCSAETDSVLFPQYRVIEAVDAEGPFIDVDSHNLDKEGWWPDPASLLKVADQQGTLATVLL